MKKPDIKLFDQEAKKIMVDREAYEEMVYALVEFVNLHTVQTTSDGRRHRKAIEALKKAGFK